MSSRKSLLKKSRIYAIIDEAFLEGFSTGSVNKKIRDLGADIIQLRLKIKDIDRIFIYANFLKRQIANTGIPFIVNDYIEIAKIVDADGVHLGQEDLSVGIARRILGRDKIIGISSHSLFQAKKAQDEGVDYIGIGPVFPTPKKPHYNPVGLGLVREVAKNMRIPFFAIGGINKDNLPEVIDAGAKRVALGRALGEIAEIREIMNYKL